MPYCPQCLIEYVEDTSKCEDCGAELLHGSPPNAPPVADLTEERDAKLVPVRIFTGGTADMDAELARNLLQSQGIASLVQGETSAELLPVLDVPLLVREEDQEKATRVLQEYFNRDDPAPPEDADSADRSST
jgi:hypothetical protein